MRQIRQHALLRQFASRHQILTTRLIIFDFDGTLADSFAWFIATMNELAPRYHYRRVENDELPRLRHMTSREILRHIGLPFWKVPFVARRVRSKRKHDKSPISLFPGVRETFEAVRGKDAEIAIVTSNSYEHVTHVLGKGIVRMIDYFECEASLFGKPKLFRRILKSASVHENEALCVGDEVRDAVASKVAGIRFVGVTWGYSDPQRLAAEHPVKMLERLVDIAELL